MHRPALLAILALVACGRSPGVPDEELGNLVIAPKQTAAPIDVARAAKDPAELGRALMRPYRDVVKALGPHTYTISTETTISEAGQQVSALADRTVSDLGEGDSFRAVYSNSSDYGREVTFEGGLLYLRPRYQRWHGRAPESPDEPAVVRDSFFEGIAATWDLLAPAAELTDVGAAEVSGRGGRKIVVKLSPSPRALPAEPLVQRTWRESRVIESVAGEIILDADSGMPLSVKLQGIVSFMRDGRRFAMKLSVDGKAAAIGSPVAIAAPPEAEVVQTPERLREVDDRDYLLQGIAPPSRRNPDGSPVPPSPKLAGSAAGSGAAPVPARAGSNSQGQ
jgi:hypothetical protein